MDLSAFAQGFHDDVMEDLTMYSGNAEEAFVERFTNILAENGEVENVQPAFWMKTTQGIKINAYIHNDSDQSLALFVADVEMGDGNLHTISHAEVEKGLKRAARFFEYSALGRIQEYIDESDLEPYDLAWLIHDEAVKLRRLELYFITNRLYKRNDTIDLSVNGVDEVQCHIWDIERLFQLVDERQSVASFTLDFAKDCGETFELLLVPRHSVNEMFDCYVGSIPGSLLAKAYKKFGQRLIERNVRSFLQARGKVNRGMKETLQQRKEMFIAYNNGISTTAESAELTPVGGNSRLFRVDSLTGWQIVNGGQTTASLYSAWNEGIDLSDVHVQAKLTVLKTTDSVAADDLISRISQYANTQNKISFSDLDANSPIQVGLEQISRAVWAPDPSGRKAQKKWYYERARGQYLVDLIRQPTTAAKKKFKLQNPKSHVVTKTQFAKYYMAWEQLPHLVSRGSEANFTEFMRLMERKKPEVDHTFFKHGIARAILFNRCDEVVRKMNLPGYKANVVAYTVALASLALGEKLSLTTIWNQQGISDELRALLAELAAVTWQYLSNPPNVGTNISQWCKKEECWSGLKQAASQTLETSSTKPVEIAASSSGPGIVHQPSTFLREHSLPFVDHLDKGGALWVLDEPRTAGLLDKLAQLGYRFRFSKKGSKSTEWRPAWFWKP